MTQLFINNCLLCDLSVVQCTSLGLSWQLLLFGLSLCALLYHFIICRYACYCQFAREPYKSNQLIVSFFLLIILYQYHVKVLFLFLLLLFLFFFFVITCYNLKKSYLYFYNVVANLILRTLFIFLFICL